MKTALLEKVEQSQLKEKAPDFQIGDSVRVHVKIKEGDKERIQVYGGTVIARDGGGRVIHLDALEGNGAAARLYLACGFVRTCVMAVHYDDIGDARTTLFERDLTGDGDATPAAEG